MSAISTFFSLTPPDGPSTPFASEVLFVDLIRVVVLLMSAYIVVVSSALIVERVGTLGMKARLAGTSLAFVFYIALTEIEHIGDYAHGRLYAGFAAGVVYCWGLWSYFKWESPPTMRVANGVSTPPS